MSFLFSIEGGGSRAKQGASLTPSSALDTPSRPQKCALKSEIKVVGPVYKLTFRFAEVVRVIVKLFASRVDCALDLYDELFDVAVHVAVIHGSPQSAGLELNIATVAKCKRTTTEQTNKRTNEGIERSSCRPPLPG